MTQSQNSRFTADYDHYDPAFALDPHDTYQRIRRECPIGRSDNYGGFYIFSKYDDVDLVLHRPEVFSSWPADTPPTPGHTKPLIPFEVDPPDHAHYRRIVNPLFAPKTIMQLEDAVRGIARSLVDDMVDAHSFDFVERFAAPFPSSVFLEMVGLDVDTDQRDWLFGVADRILHTTGAPPGDVAAQTAVRLEAGKALHDFLAGLYEARMVRRGDDIISTLIDAEFGSERPMSRSEILNFAYIMVLGGLDTVTTALAFSFLCLGRRPDLQDQLAADPTLLPSAIEELLRYESAIHPSRTVTQAINVRGTALRPGDRVVLPLASADRDEDVFDGADEIILDRRPNRHLAFGAGIHRCLGMHLARMELRVAFEEILSRIPRFSIPPEAEIRAHGGQTRSLANLPLQTWRDGDGS